MLKYTLFLKDIQVFLKKKTYDFFGKKLTLPENRLAAIIR